MEITKIAFLCSGAALKPQIILKNLSENKFFKNKSIWLITDKNDLSTSYFFKSNNVYVLEDVQFTEKDILTLQSYNLDVIISLGWPHLIPKKMINDFNKPIINCHGSYLPDYRGSRAYMHYWANNEEYFGASIHFVTEKFDDGNVLIRNKIKKQKNESKESVHFRSCELSALQIPIAIKMLEDNKTGININNEKARYYKKDSFDNMIYIGNKNRKLDFTFAEDMLQYKHTNYKIIDNFAPRVMIVGAGILQYYLIQKVNELGYISIAVDGNPEAIGFTIADFHQVIDIKDKDLCLEYAKRMHIDGVITGATDYGVITTSYIAKKLRLNGLNYDVANIIKNKFAVQNILFKHEIIKQPCYEISSINELNFLKDTINYPIIIKPCDGSGSRGVNKVNNSKDINNCVKEAINNSLINRCIIEPFIEGKEYGAEFYVYNGVIYDLITLSKKMTDYPFFAELGHSYNMDKKIENKILQKGHQIIKTLGINFGSVNMDFIVNNKEVYMVDIGCRMGGNLIGSHIIPMSTGVDYMEMIINGALNKNIHFEKKFSKAISTKLIVLPTGTVTKINRDKINDVDCLYKVILCKVNDIVHSYRNNLDGCGYVICNGENTLIAENKVEKALEKIQKSISVLGDSI